MATIVVEDGTGKTDSNSYISEADFSTYANDRGVTISGTASILLVQAMDYIEQQKYKGIKNSSSQALQFPRSGVVIDGYIQDSDSIPQLLRDAQCEVAIAIDSGNNPLSNVERVLKRTKVGSIELEYSDGSRDTVYLSAVENKLTKLISGGRSINVQVVRA